MSKANHLKSVALSLGAVFFLWFSWGFWRELFTAIAAIWAWRPATIIGAVMIMMPILLAYPVHYLLNVRRTSKHGSVMVNGFIDYLGHQLANIAVRLLFIASFFVGIFILLFGFNIR
ncbi:MAG: hypothetical protein JJ891_16165 [Rhizobiaceae bacterium]|jgi:hypothetical protein|nr:hypothetical protein [Rhizobiaceae bacterium]